MIQIQFEFSCLEGAAKEIVAGWSNQTRFFLVYKQQFHFFHKTPKIISFKRQDFQSLGGYAVV